MRGLGEPPLHRASRRGRILAVEDDPASAELIVEILSERWDVYVATNAREAVERFNTLQPDLLVLDMRLGEGSDGLDVFQEIRRMIGRSPRAILVSSADEAPDTAQAIQIPVLRKPIRERTLVDLVEIVLATDPGEA